MFMSATYDTESRNLTVDSDVISYDTNDPFFWTHSIDIEYKFESSLEIIDHKGFSFGWDVYQEDVLLFSEFIPRQDESIVLLKSSYVLYGVFEGQEEKDSKVVFWAEKNGERVFSELSFVFPRHPLVIPNDLKVKFAILGDE